MLRLVLLVAALLLASACGAGKAATVTVTSSPPPSQTSTVPSPADDLRAYLTAMVKAEQQWNHAERVWGKDDKVHYYNNTAPWPAIGQKLVFVRRMFDASAVYVSSVAPPTGLAKAHRAWLSSINLTSAEADNYVTAFESKDVASVYRLDNSPGRDHQIGTLRTAWRLAVLALAKSLSVPVPKALRIVGTGY
jgi:hypothetical protein